VLFVVVVVVNTILSWQPPPPDLLSLVEIIFCLMLQVWQLSLLTLPLHPTPNSTHGVCFSYHGLTVSLASSFL